MPLLIIAAIAIPNLLRARMAANEASAVGTLRTLNVALVGYSARCATQGYPATLGALGPGDPRPGNCSHAHLVAAELAAAVPTSNGYRFFYIPNASDSGGRVVRFALAADPINPGASGQRHFFSDETGVIRWSTTASADAQSEPLQ